MDLAINDSLQSPHPASRRVAIVLVNWNGWKDTVACLDSILGLRHPNFMVYIVDNASTDGSEQHLRQWCRHPKGPTIESRRAGVRSGAELRPGAPVALFDVDFDEHSPEVAAPAGTEVVFVRSGSNRGFAGGNNVGMKCAGLRRFDYFWLLNTDTVVDESALGELLARAAADRRAGMVGSTLMLYWNPTIVQAMGGGSFDRSRMRPQHLGEGRGLAEVAGQAREVEQTMSYVVGASMLVSRQFVEDVGWMMEDYFLYFEELDWAVRAQGRYLPAYAHRSIVYHKVGGSTVRVASLASTQALYRSRLKFVARYFPRRYPLLVLRLLFDELPRHLAAKRWVHARALGAAIAGVVGLYVVGAAGRPTTGVAMGSDGAPPRR